MANKRTYSRSFKLQALELARRGQKSISQICTAVEKLDRFGVKLKEISGGEPPSRTQRALHSAGPSSGLHTISALRQLWRS